MDCTDEDFEYLIVKGGEGGHGNARFKSATNRAPRKSTPAGRWVLSIELKSLADVGLVGFPQASQLF